MKNDRLGNFAERYLLYVLSLALACLAFFISHNIIIRIEKDLSNSILTLVSIFTGVVAASITLILSQNPAPGSVHIKNSRPQCDLFIKYHISCISIGVACCVLSILAILIPPSKPEDPILVPIIANRIFLFIWLFCIFGSLLSFLRVVFLLRMLLLLDVNSVPQVAKKLVTEQEPSIPQAQRQ